MSNNPTVDEQHAITIDAQHSINRARSELQLAYEILEEANVTRELCRKRVQTALDSFEKSVRVHNVQVMKDVAFEIKEKHERASDNHGQ